MQNEFLNRLTAFTTSLDTLSLEENEAIWMNKPPLIFTQKVAEAEIMVEAIQTAQKNQEAGIGGNTEEKDREEDELEAAVYMLAQALVLYYRDHGRETEAGALNLTPSDWEDLRDAQLLAKSLLVVEQATSLSGGTEASKTTLYGITPEAVAALTKERKDYDEIINAPAVAIGIRKALTKGFRPAFSLTEEKFKDLDKLILQFGGNPAGRALVAGWKNARMVKDAGHGPGQAVVTSGLPTVS